MLNQPNKVAAPRMPDTYLILLGVALLAFLLTYLVPAGSFDVVKQLQSDGSEKVLLNPESFSLLQENAEGAPLFAEGGNIGLLNLPFEGMVSGNKYGTSIGVFAFIIIAGGSFGMIMATGAIDRGLMRLISISGRADVFFIPVIFITFSLGGAVFGMGEEAIPFVLIVVPFLISLGYDSITGLLVTYVATQIGFSTSWMNPFSVSIAQGVAGVPLLSGAGFRMICWSVFTLLGLIYTLRYAKKVRAFPQLSIAWENDNQFRAESYQRINHDVLSWHDRVILLIFFAGISWIVWGVTTQGYYLPEIASQFFAIGFLIAIVAVVLSRNNFTANQAAISFKEGASQLLPAALVVAFAKGIVLLLGGDDPSTPSVLNTLLFNASQLVDGLPESLAALCMLAFQSVFNFFVTSGSGQAALTMPLMAPLADLVGVTRQTAVLAFQLGDGLTNILVPTSAALMGCLGAARLDWSLWFRFVISLQCLLFLLAAAAMLIAVAIGF
ncbi:putative basic amino acid antiporter YfcC [Oceanicoccus sp. KOV_DT_Chl]|uniref:putative basic amino acid antiporter YfcC n=1 Tax=Oceanicoccus sp. KOV_DT_Chl TaxID=1904639 RepID=UPI000C7CA48B|nr:putative basic amino acid antiporter YfcC [Oceanicoccus sp. KOV_DT_Chl]